MLVAAPGEVLPCPSVLGFSSMVARVMLIARVVHSSAFYSDNQPTDDRWPRNPNMSRFFSDNP
jgi:hypothetical protein